MPQIWNFAPVTAEQEDALKLFASVYGRRWKTTLSDVYWYNARIFLGDECQSRRAGEILHGLRNSHGPNWLFRYKLPR